MCDAQPSIFISCVRSSSGEAARTLKAVLGEEAFLDESEIELGEDFVGTIRRRGVGQEEGSQDARE